MKYKKYLVEIDREINRIIKEISRYKYKDPEKVSKMIKYLKTASAYLREYNIKIVYDPAYKRMLKAPDFILYIFCQGAGATNYSIERGLKELKKLIKKKIIPKEAEEITEKLKSIKRALNIIIERTENSSKRMIRG